jgi:hypothetical protein
MRPRRLLLLLAAAACSVGLTACGSFDSAASGQNLIKDYVTKFGRGRITLTSAKCPGNISQKTGGSYDCKVVVQDKQTGKQHPGTITVHMQSGNKVSINGASDVHIP